MSKVHHSRVPNDTTANINEAKDIAASVHRDVLSWAVWRGHKEKKSVSFAAVMPDASSQSAVSFSCNTASSLLRTGSVPDVVGADPTTSTPSQSVSTALDAVCASSMRFLTPQPFGKAGFSKSKMRTTNSQADFCGQTSSMVKPNALRQTYSPSDRLAVKGPGKRKEQVVRNEEDRNLEGSPNHASNRTSFHSCVHFDIPPSSIFSAVFLVKSLSISLEVLKTNPALHTSTFSCRLAMSNVNKSKSANHRRASRYRESGSLSYCRGLQSKQKSYKVTQIAPANMADSDPQCHSATLGLLTFSGQSPPYIKTTRQKGNADEEVQVFHSNFKHSLHTDAGSWDKQSGEKEVHSEEDCSNKPNRDASLNTFKTCYYHSRLKEDTVDGAAKSLSLQEALELLRPDFISRSQSRVKRLEQRARTRRAHCDSGPGPVHGFGEDRGKHRRNCTTPDPLSDNLFKPRERTISGREMQLRSRRIYNKLPEVTKRRQEEKRRAVSQTNRLRAEVYKKKLLDQVLQR